MKTRKVIIFQPAISVQGCRWQGPLLAAQGARWEPTVDRMPFHHRATHIQIQLRLGQCRHSSSPNGHTFGIWEDSSPWGKPMQTCGERANSTQTWPWPRSDFFSLHQCYNETVLNKTMLFKDQLYFGKSNIGVSFQVEHIYPYQIIIFLLLAFNNSRS